MKINGAAHSSLAPRWSTSHFILCPCGLSIVASSSMFPVQNTLFPSIDMPAFP